MITCWSCGKDNEAFFKFCLACGAELDNPPGAEASASSVLSSSLAGPVTPLAGGAAFTTPAQTQSSVSEVPLRPEVVVPAAPAVLVCVRPDQSDGERRPVDRGRTQVGRRAPDLSFEHDAFLAAHHFDLIVDSGVSRVEPLPSRNGTFLRLRERVAVDHGDEFRIGQQLLRIEWVDRLVAEVPSGPHGETTLGSPVADAVWGRLCVVEGEDRLASAHLLSADEVVLGREQGDVTFGHDPFVSGRHARFVRHADGQVEFEDAGSRNGSFIRLKQPSDLRSGDTLLAGQQLLRMELTAG